MVVDVRCGVCPILLMVRWMFSVVDVWCGGCVCGGCRIIDNNDDYNHDHDDDYNGDDNHNRSTTCCAASCD